MPTVDVQQVTEEYFPRIHRAALVLCGNPWDADDLAQETFLVFSRQSTSFQGKSSVYTYLYGILLNLERRQRRQSGMKRRKLRVLWDDQPEERTAPAAETPLEVREWKNSLWSLVARLPDGQRQALALRFASHLRYEEIAEALECPLGTVKSRIFHGLASLRTLLAETGVDCPQSPRDAWEDLHHAM